MALDTLRMNRFLAAGLATLSDGLGRSMSRNQLALLIGKLITTSRDTCDEISFFGIQIRIYLTLK